MTFTDWSDYYHVDLWEKKVQKLQKYEHPIIINGTENNT